MEEQSNPRQHDHSAQRKSGTSSKAIISVAVVVAVAALGFFGGMQYQKSKVSSTTTTGQQTGGYGMGMNGIDGRASHMGEFGTVTAVSSTSISVKNDRTSSTKTYAISSSTTFTKDSASAAYSDVTVGDTVLVEANSSDSSTASSIVINPSMNGGPMDSSGTSTQTQTN